MRMRVHFDTGSAVFDHIDFEPYGTIRICGWSKQADLPHCEVHTVDGGLPPSPISRHIRDDLARALGGKHWFVGFSVEFPVRGAQLRRVVFAEQSIEIPERLTALLNSEIPQYVNLLDDDRVLHRGDIYGEGAPSDNVT